ncbi:MAG: hypothetical protein AB1483_12465 [Candidatus Zixiibacteriota bacterium]
MIKEMCRATYHAQQIAGSLIIYANGVHHQTGYEVSFERVGVTILPPHFSFMHQASNSTVLNKITPFTHHVTVPMDKKVDKVVIYDAGGRHEVQVQQITAEQQRTASDS